MNLVERIIPESSSHPLIDVNCAWLAGIFEGEGSMKFNRVNSVSLCVGMTDEDVVRKLAAVSGRGTVTGPHHYGNKPIWRWHVTMANDVEFLLDRMLPHLGKRRGSRALEALVRLQHVRRGILQVGGVCIHGHKLTVANLLISVTGHRCCRECRRVGQRARAAQRRAAA